MARLLAVGIALAWWMAGLAPALAAQADGPRRAALAVVFGDGRLLTRCIQFEGEDYTGVDLLADSGLATVVDASSGMGITVCQIEDVGCPYPAARCFCQCTGGSGCRYWNYYYREAGQAAWTYSTLGALLRRVQPGSVEAWVWGDGRHPPADDLTFASICPEPAPTPPSAPPADIPSTSPSLAGGQGEAGQVPAPTAGLREAPATEGPPAGHEELAPSPTGAAPTPEGLPPAEAAPGLGPYWPFGALLLLLIGLGAYLRLGRR